MKTTRTSKAAKTTPSALVWDLLWSAYCTARRSGDAVALAECAEEIHAYDRRHGFPLTPL